MKRILLPIVLLVFFNSYSQQSKIDSLDKVFQKSLRLKSLSNRFLYNNPSQSIKYSDSLILLNAKSNLGVAYRNKSIISLGRIKYNDALKNIDIAIRLDSTDNNIRSLGIDYWVKGNYSKDISEITNALRFLYLSKNIYDTINDNKFKGILHRDIGVVYSYQSKNDSAIVYYKKALEFSSNVSDSINILLVNYLENQLLKKTMSRYTEALDFLDYAKKKKELYYIARGQLQLGNSFGSVNNLDTLQLAKKYLDSSIIFFQKHKYNYFLQGVYARLSHIYKKLNNNDLSLYYLEKNYENLKNSDSFFKEMTILNLGINYLNNKKVKLAEAKFKEIIQISKTKELQKILVSLSYQHLSEIYEEKKLYKKSLDYYKKFKKIEDQSYSTQITTQVNDFKVKYETEKKEKENLQLKTEKVEQALLLEKETKQKWLLGVGLISSLIILAIGGYFYQKNKKQKEVIETLQKDLHHRVKNNLAIINRFIDVVKEEFNNEAFDSKLIELQNRIASINEVHQQLYNSKDATKLGVKKYIEKLKQNIENTYVNKNITVEQHIDATVNLKADTSFPIGLIVNEFLTNSFKYAFTNAEKGKILININETDNHYKLELADNGRGFPKDFDSANSKTFGLRIMKLLTQQINGTFKISGSNGVKLTIQFPK